MDRLKFCCRKIKKKTRNAGIHVLNLSLQEMNNALFIHDTSPSKSKARQGGSTVPCRLRSGVGSEQSPVLVRLSPAQEDLCARCVRFFGGHSPE